MRFVRKCMTPPNLSLVSWIGISGGAKFGVDTGGVSKEKFRPRLGCAEVCRACFPFEKC